MRSINRAEQFTKRNAAFVFLEQGHEGQIVALPHAFIFPRRHRFMQLAQHRIQLVDVSIGSITHVFRKNTPGSRPSRPSRRYPGRLNSRDPATDGSITTACHTLTPALFSAPRRRAGQPPAATPALTVPAHLPRTSSKKPAQGRLHKSLN